MSTPTHDSPPVGTLPGEMPPDPNDTIVVEGDPNRAGLQNLGALLRAEFDFSEGQRRYQEELWLKDLRQYKGVYDPEKLAKMHPKRSKAFIRLTRMKVRGTDARMGDLLFPAGDQNWELDKPSFDDLNPADHAMDLALALIKRGIPPDQVQVAAQGMGAAEVKEALSEVAEAARVAMRDEIMDQLEQGNYEAVSRDVLHSGHLYGTGILKGPVSGRRYTKRWKPTQVQGALVYAMVEEEEKFPHAEMRPVWNVYPDPFAVTIGDCEYVWDRHTLTRGDLRKLTKRAGFKDKAAFITSYLNDHPEGDAKMRWWEVEMMALGERWAVGQPKNRFELLERWGMLTGKMLRENGLQDKISEDRADDEFACTLWLLGNQVVRIALEPLERATNPFKLYYYENDESSIWGSSLPFVYRDNQEGFNSAIRVTVDNAAVAGGPQVEVNRDLLDDEDDIEDIFPFRVWARTGSGAEAMAPAVRVYEVPSYVQQNLELVQVFKQLGDEVTTAQSYTYGDPGKNAANTVGGLSMLLGQSGIALKDQAKQWDDGITAPFITDMVDWNMQHSKRADVKGDHKVVARGTSALVAKEIRAHALAQFRTTTANPVDGPFTGRRYLLREEAKALDLDADKAVPDRLDADDLPPRLEGVMPGAPGMAPPGPPGAPPVGGPPAAGPAVQGASPQQAAAVAAGGA